jgi:DNA-binding MarR family transcriptional regulator
MPVKSAPRSSRRAAEMGARKSSLPRAAASARANLELQTLQALRIFGSARVHDAEIRRIASISGSQLWALSEIARSSAMSVKALAKAMALKQTSASNLVNALVERKLIRRARDAGDQRVVHLHVSQEGRRMLARAPGPYAGLLVDALQHLERDQLAQLREYLQLLVAVMKRPAASAAGETLLGE